MKCLCCQQLFLCDRRNQHHQKFCSKPDCRKASKRHSQQRWLSKPQNKDHFRGSENMERVRLWREDHPGYWRKRKKKSAGTLQDVCLNQAPDPKPVAEADPQDLFRRTLQDLCLAQTPLLVGLLSQLVDSPLQEDIVLFARRMVAKGQDLLDIPSGRSLNQTLAYDTQKTSPSRSAAADSAAL
jgi:hypothetical protein